MATIGVTELRRHASRWLARARAGEVITITDRGRPVAQLGPLPELTGYDALVAAGRITPGIEGGTAAVLARLDALPIDPPRPGRPSMSEALEELRRDER